MNYQSLVGPAIWIIPIAVVLWFALRANRLRRAANKAEAVSAVMLRTQAKALGRKALYALAFTLVVPPALAFVPAGHRGVVYDLGGGVLPEERPEGLSLVLPWFQHITPIDVRTQVYSYAEFFAQSSDLQEIKVPIAVNVHIDPERAAELYQEVGPDYGAKVIRPAIDQHAKAAIGQVTAEAFPQARTELAGNIVSAISSQLAGYGIVVEYANVADAVFDKSFMESVRNKVIAEQNVAEARRRVQEEEYRKQQEIKKAEGERQAAILAGEGVAEANRLIEESLTPTILAWQRLIQWNGMLPQTLIGGDGSPLDTIIQLPEARFTAPEVESEVEPFPYGGGSTEEEPEPNE